MFTGLIEKIGTLEALIISNNSAKVKIKTGWTDLVLGESIAVNGACLTVSDVSGEIFTADLSQETLKRTNFENMKINSPLNMERALKVGDRLAGHFVAGHVDGVAKVAKIVKKPQGSELKISLDRGGMKYIVEKGSIAIDGISLTISGKEHEGFWIAVIPHTLENTNLKYRKIGDRVNLEFDMMVKYTESLINKDGR
jgi:riboflavin synthase